MNTKRIIIACVIFLQNFIYADEYRAITENDYKGDGPIAVFFKITKCWESENYEEIKNYVTEKKARFAAKPFFRNVEMKQLTNEGYTSLNTRTDQALADKNLDSIIIEFKNRSLQFEKINGKWLWAMPGEFNSVRWNKWWADKIKEKNKANEQKLAIEIKKKQAESDRKFAYEQKEGQGWEDVKVSDIKEKSQIEAVFKFIKARQEKAKDFSQICTKEFLSSPPSNFNDIDINRDVPFWINKNKIIEKYNKSDKLGRMFFYAFKIGSGEKIGIWAEFLKKDGRWILCTQSDQINLRHSEKH